MLIALAVLAGCSFRTIAPAQDASAGDDADIAEDATGRDATEAVPCPLGYQPINGSGMYRVINASTATWQAAAADCNDDDDAGGPYTGYTHLIVLGGEAERISVTTGTTPVMGNSWIGLNDLATEGTFVWVTSEPTGGYPMVGQQPPWDSDDPDNAGGVEDCGRFKNSFVLEDKPCTDMLRYVCECDAYPPN